MKKVSDVFKSIRFAKAEPRGKPHSSTDDEEHGAVGEKEFNQQLQHVKKRAMQEDSEQLGEARASAAVRLQRALERERVKSDASRRRGEEVMAQARAEVEKKLENEKKIKEEVEQVDEVRRGGFTAGWRDEKHFGKGVPTNRPMTDKEKVESDKTKDIQNYLNNLSKNRLKKEEVEQIDELSKDTLHGYVKKSFSDKEKSNLNTPQRQKGLRKATSRLYKEEPEQINEKNVPTSPEKWAQAKAQAKAKFDVYPSAYANGWAAKKYKEMGGGWKSVNESEEPPFEGPYKKIKKGPVTDKSGAKHGPMSIARHLARQALKKQTEKMKPVKESLEESRKAEIVKEIVKKKKAQNDKFESDPVLSSQIVKEDK